MEDNFDNLITDETLLIKPFACFLGDIKLPMEDIFNDSKNFKKDIEEFKLLGKTYSLKFSEKDKNECEMNIYLKDSFVFRLNLFYEPIILQLDNLNLSTKQILLYSNIQIKEMIYCFKSKYEFYDQDNKILDEGQKFDILKKINVSKKLEYNINDKIFLDFKKDINGILKTILNNKEKTIEIAPLFLSFNFYKIFPDQLTDKPFKLIVNDERKNFLEKLKNFIVSKDKLYLWIIGCDGIGKTISLMYHTLISDGNSIYLNLKLLSKNSDKMKSLFINEIIRFFYFKNRDSDEETFMVIQNEIKYIFKKIFHITEEENKLEQKYKFWIYLKNLVSELKRIFMDTKIIIILDQYRDISIDYEYKYINSFLKNIFSKRYKIIFSTSINNYEFQSNFFNNIDTFNFILDDEEQSSIDSDLEEKSDENKEEYDIKQECDFYEEILNKKVQKNMQKNMVKKTTETISVKSPLLLNNELKDYTLKLYYSSLVSGKILENDFEEQEKKCFKNFNYNLKYINKFKKYKNDYENKLIDENSEENEGPNINLLNQKTEENQGNNQEEHNIDNSEIKEDKNNISEAKEKIKNNPILGIINNFYNRCYNHITSKIDNFYSVKENSIFGKDINVNEYDKLKELRDIIYNKDFLDIKELREKMKLYPCKYINIINKNFTNLEPKFYPHLENLQIKYSNKFFKLTLNELLTRIENKIDISSNNIRGS